MARSRSKYCFCNRNESTVLAPFQPLENKSCIAIKCTAVSGLDEVKCLKASATCDLVLVVLKSLEDVPSPFLIPSSRKPSVAVDDIVSRQTMYLKKDT